MTSTSLAVSHYFGIQTSPPIVPLFNIAPGQDILAVRQNEKAENEATLLHWGLIPSWAKDTSIGWKLTNARSETVMEKPSFRSSYHSRRCLIPVDGFYEWQHVGRQKQPYYFHRTDGDLFALAGLWERWVDKGKEEIIESCTILTCEANFLVSPIHHRMPVVMGKSDFPVWLDASLDAVDLIKPYEWLGFESVPVSTYVNNSRNEGSECISPV